VIDLCETYQDNIKEGPRCKVPERGSFNNCRRLSQSDSDQAEYPEPAHALSPSIKKTYVRLINTIPTKHSVSPYVTPLPHGKGLRPTRVSEAISLSSTIYHRIYPELILQGIYEVYFLMFDTRAFKQLCRTCLCPIARSLEKPYPEILCWLICNRL